MAEHDKKIIAAWCLYDWANSAFATLVVTFVYGAYFTKEIAPDIETGTVLWSRGIAVSAVLVALASPLLGALADRSGSRKGFLLLSTLTCAGATAVLAFIKPALPHAALLALAVFIAANVAFELGIVFYNAYLPEIARPDAMGRISGYGWGLGYGGGIVCLLTAFLILTRETPLLGISASEGFQYRATNLLAAAWFVLFSLPFFVVAPPDKKKPLASFRRTLADFGRILTVVRQYREVTKFLLAHLVYNDGLVTIFAFGGIYAAGTFGMSLNEVALFGIVLNIAAGAGALLFGPLDDKIGGKKTILLSLAGLCLATLGAVLAASRWSFWLAAIGIGVFVGPNQSASRSLMGRLAPAPHRAEFFGFFTLSGKITSFLGPLALGTATALFRSQRAGVATILFFLITGGIVLTTVKETKEARNG